MMRIKSSILGVTLLIMGGQAASDIAESAYPEALRYKHAGMIAGLGDYERVRVAREVKRKVRVPVKERVMVVEGAHSAVWRSWMTPKHTATSEKWAHEKALGSVKSITFYLVVGAKVYHTEKVVLTYRQHTPTDFHWVKE